MRNTNHAGLHGAPFDLVLGVEVRVSLLVRDFN